MGAEAALYFTSGYAANIGLLTTILRPGDVVFSDSANHASLIDGIRLAKCRRVIFPHLDLNILEEELRRSASVSGARVIVVESIFSMEGDRAPLADLAALAERYGAAIGVRGPLGNGCVAEAGLSARVLASMHTCGKALASAGAFVCGSASLRRLLVNRARTFIFNTALPPYFAAQVAAGMSLAVEAEDERAHLMKLSAFLRNELRKNGFDIHGSDSQIVPVILGPNDVAVHFAETLKANGFGAARLRLSLTAQLSETMLADLVVAMILARSERSNARTASLSR